MGLQDDGLSKCWMVKVVGDQSEFLHPVTGKLVSGAVLHLKSTVWPGFNLFYKDGEMFRLYVGSGEKYATKSYFPKLTVNVQVDEEDPVPIDEHEAKAKPVEADKPADE